MEDTENFDDLDDVLREMFKEKIDLIYLKNQIHRAYSFFNIISCLNNNVNIEDIVILANKYRDDFEELLDYISSIDTN